MILEFARRRNDRVGSNLDGAVAPPFWAYLLSSLELIFPCVLGEVSPDITRGIALWEEPTRLASGEEIPERARLLLIGPGAFANGVRTWIGAKGRDQAIWADPSTAEQIAKELGVPHTWWLLPEGTPRNSLANGNRHARGIPIRIPARQSRGKRNRAIRIATRVLRRFRLVPPERNWQVPFAELVPGGEPRTSVDTEGTLFLPDAPCDPPNWLLEIARLSDVDLAGRDWSILPARGFRSQKVSFFFGEKKGSVEPDSIAIKMTQDAQFNERLLNEHRALSLLTAREHFAVEGIPRPLFAGSHRGLAVIGQTKVPGEPFASLASGKVDCPVAARGLEAIHDLAVRSARNARGVEHAEAIKLLLQKLEDIYRPGAELLQAAHQAVDALARIEHVPTVFLHGDPEPQNMIVGTGGRIALLDWENAELDGPPLWDHFSFVIAYTRLSLERSGIRPTPRSVANRLLSPSPWSEWMTRSTSALATRLNMPPEAAAPLLTLHAAVMAVREAWRLNPARVSRGMWIRWMGELVRRRDSLRGLRGGA
jgi:hypothetical protein